MCKCHDLKILPRYFADILIGNKTFEIRKNDRNFELGDYINLREWDPDKQKYTGSHLVKQICYMTDYEQQDGYVVLGLRPYLW
ncbi:ASCH/PUA domain-containing protein [Pectinatus frisingensis]|uniref:ASCH/PUA domain-containing protein n=1 Tax=Pectinatus frisingensis TaxID=865 RepID=UPI0018C47D5E|nr:ASCH/PUA domain-containing protein [Pectinatus frisingensis]